MYIYSTGFSTNHNSLLRMATNEIASICINHRSRQMAFFRAKAGQRGAKGRLLPYVNETKYKKYVTQIDSMLPCV